MQELGMSEEERKSKVKTMFDYKNIKVFGEAETFADVLELSAKIKEQTKRIDAYYGIYFESHVNRYKATLDTSLKAIQNCNINNEEMRNLLRLGTSAERGGFSDEIQALSKIDQNYLKQRVFESFKNVATAEDKKSLEQELAVLNEKDNKKGIAKIFGGLTKEEKTRKQSLENFLYTYRPNEEKGDKIYSARNIVAEMEMFIEDNENNAKYQKAIERTNELKQILNEVFAYSREDVERIKLERRNMPADDKKMARMLRLEQEKENCKNVNTNVKCPQITSLEEVANRLLREKNLKAMPKDEMEI